MLPAEFIPIFFLNKEEKTIMTLRFPKKVGMSTLSDLALDLVTSSRFCHLPLHAIINYSQKRQIYSSKKQSIRTEFVISPRTTVRFNISLMIISVRIDRLLKLSRRPELKETLSFTGPEKQDNSVSQNEFTIRAVKK